MAIKFNIEPYWDDFNQATTVDGLSPKEKYNKILFRPGHAIQARELTQLQSQLQNQISSHADHMFKDGSVVVPGEINVHNRIDYIKVDTDVTIAGSFVTGTEYTIASLGTTTQSQWVTSGVSSETTAAVGVTFTAANVGEGDGTTISNFLGKEINDETNYAKVIHVVTETPTDPVTLFVKYVSGSSKFADNANLFVTGTSFDTIVDETGLGSLVSISEGIYYIKKHFVIVKSQTIVLEKYSVDVTYDVGFNVTESLIDSSTDSSLVDNAQGTPNKSAPGAHRYSIKAILAKKSTTSTTGNFILLIRLEGGAVVKSPSKKTQYNIIGDTMARRTFDESGNYTVNPFPVSIKNHASDPTKLVASVEPSKAYVQGFEIETTSVTNININKSRNSELSTDKVVQIESNNYIDVSAMSSYPNITNFELIDIINASSTTVATVRVRSIVGLGSSVYRLHVFDYQASDALTIADCTLANLGNSSPTFTANIDDANLGSDTLVFSLPNSRVKTLDSITDVNINTANFNCSYDAIRILGDDTNIVNGVATFNAASGETIGATSNLNNWLLIDNTANNPINLTLGSITIAGDASSVSISGLSSYDDVTLIAPVNKNVDTIGELKKKVKASGSTTLTYDASLDYHQYQVLGHSDVFTITSVVDSSSVPITITDNFEIDSGQTESYYGHGKVKLKSTSNYVMTGNVTVTYDYFVHGTGDFFTVDSYPSNVDYEDIPTFESIELRSAVDFRPRMADDASNFTGTGASTTTCPIPNSQFETDIQYYLDRVDKVFINKEGILDVVYGVSSLNPQAPESPKDSMILYELYVRAYTLTPEEVGITFIDNKRYTMKDIGKIDNRVSNLEYYTTLSLLETEANAIQVLNPEDGTLRFKSGFLVDSFKSTKVGRTSSPEYKAGIDPRNGSLRPLFSEGNAKLLYETTNNSGTAISTTTVTGDLITIPYTNTALITQTQSSGSINVNLYSVFNWTGTIKLTPHSDEWKDIDRRPIVMLNNDGVYNALLQSLQETTSTGTVWGSWESNWVGKSKSSTASYGYPTDPATTTTTITTSDHQVKSGTKTSIETGTVISDLGDRQVSIAFRPFIRSRVVKFEATLLRPNTRVYAFFDGVDISDWVRAYDSSDTDPVPLVGPNSETAHPNGATTLTTDANGAISGTFYVPNNSSINFSTGQREFILVDSTTPETTSTVTTFASSAYYAKGLLETVENIILSTRTPYVHRVNISNTRIVSSSTSSTSTQTQPSSTGSDTGNQTSYTDYTQTTPVTGTTPNLSAAYVSSAWHPGGDIYVTYPCYTDPLAQSFMVDMSGGVMVTALDLYFTAADENIPVSVSIRTMLNGSPTQTVVPYSEKTLNPYESNGTTRIVKVDGTATKFWFDSPVHLQENVEYCFVIMSNSDSYRVKYATQGLEDSNGDLIIKQPYNGVMFKSQNASTWTEDQTSDLTFVMHRAVFETDTNYYLALSNEELPARSLFNNPLTLSNTNGTVTVSHNNHGMSTGDSVTIAGATVSHGISAVNLNGTFIIAGVKRNSYTYTADDSDDASSSGVGGGTSVSATQNLAFNILHPVVQSLTFPGTAVGWGIRDTLEGGSLSSTYLSVVPNSNYYPQAPMIIKSGSTPSIILAGTMRTTKNNISPVVDMTRCSVIAISNVIDDNITVLETDKINGSSLAKYLTKTVQLDNPSNILKVYLDTNRPKSTDIDVYYKIGSDSGTFDDKNWVEFPAVTVPFSDDINVYKEVEFNLDATDEFTMFSIKIVFTSSNTNRVPSVRNLRSIALV